jgi:hypothetical protein
MMTRLVFFWFFLVSFSQAELIPAVADEACELSGDVSLSQYRVLGSVLQTRGNVMKVEIPDYDLVGSCNDSAGCEKSPLRKPLGQGDFYEVITYTF